ncbi:hypothetical protein FB451DRAFT_1241183, partial [Mycena latifolia]
MRSERAQVLEHDSGQEPLPPCARLDLQYAQCALGAWPEDAHRRRQPAAARGDGARAYEAHAFRKAHDQCKVGGIVVLLCAVLRPPGAVNQGASDDVGEIEATDFSREWLELRCDELAYTVQGQREIEAASRKGCAIGNYLDRCLHRWEAEVED